LLLPALHQRWETTFLVHPSPANATPLIRLNLWTMATVRPLLVSFTYRSMILMWLHAYFFKFLVVIYNFISVSITNFLVGKVSI